MEYLFANRKVSHIDSDPSLYIQQSRAVGFRIPEKPSEVVARTIQALGLDIYPSPIPSIDIHIAALVSNSGRSHPGINYGTFVKTQDGKIAFAKFKYGPLNTRKVASNGTLIDVPIGGLKREVEVMKSLKDNGYQLPEVFGYYPATPVELNPESDTAITLETLVEESIPHDQGSTFVPERWTPELARVAAQKIKTFAKPSSKIALFQGEDLQLPYEILLQRAQLSGQDVYATELKDIIDSYPHGDEPIVVHGDTWLNNILVTYDQQKVLFIDWELAGPGYVGQDAGRTLWGLTTDKNWNFAEVSAAAGGFINEWCQTKNERGSLRFGIGIESLRWIADRQDILRTRKMDQEERLSMESKIEDIKVHTLKVLSQI